MGDDIDTLIEEVIRAAASGRPGELVHRTVIWLAEQAPILAAEVRRLRLDVEDEAKGAVLHRRLNERIAGALGLLGVRTDPETGEEYLSSWHDMPERVAALVAEREELRLTLAAEIGRVEGAPSARWRCDGRHWYADRGDGGMDEVEMYGNLNGDGTVLHKRVWLVCDMHGFEEERGRFDLARPAMVAADKSLKTGSPS